MNIFAYFLLFICVFVLSLVCEDPHSVRLSVTVSQSSRKAALSLSLLKCDFKREERIFCCRDSRHRERERGKEGKWRENNVHEQEKQDG